MRLVIVSDSHENKRLQQEFINQLSDHKPDLVFHLGDFYKDAEAILSAGYPVIRVPGTWTDVYQNPMIDNRRYETFEGWTFFLTHTPDTHYNDLPEDEDPESVLLNSNCDVLLHGHTHHPKIEQVNKSWVINPGHTKSDFDRDFEPTYVVADLSTDVFHVKFINLLDKTVREERELKKLI
jgi:putative phosphoesterase